MADLHQPDLAITEVLDEFGVDGLIIRAFQGERRIALLRIHHAAENAQSAIDWVTEVLALYITNPAAYREEITENTGTLAAKLRSLANELEKSLPTVSLREDEHAANLERGLRREDRPPTEEGNSTPPTELGDWGDVPF